jgi:ribosome-associated protein
LEIARSIIDVLEEKKGEDILLLDIKEITTIADYFVICSGTSRRMLQALAEAVEKYLKEHYKMRTILEGLSQNGWILADYGDIVVHFFSVDQRAYYRLEDLWSNGKVLIRLQ